jgi:hypothetical protein
MLTIASDIFSGEISHLPGHLLFLVTTYRAKIVTVMKKKNNSVTEE